MATQSWERALLKSLRVPVTPQNIKFLQSWQRWEGGHTKNDATYNWLNTTRNTPGAVRSINEVGVKAYRNFRSGIQALNQTLNNGRYGDILDALKAGDPYGSDLSSGLSTWVSGSPTGNLKYAAKVMGTKVSRAKPAGAGRGVAAALPAFDMNPLNIAFADDPEFVSLLAMVNASSSKLKNPKLDPDGSLDSVAPKGEHSGVLEAAQSQLGKPYVFGSGPDTSSFDCSDLIQWAYKQTGVDIPRTTYEQMKVLPRKEWKDIQPGDLVYKDNGGHVVMYMGNGKVIAAPYTGTVVQFQPLSKFKQGGYHVRYVPRKR